MIPVGFIKRSSIKVEGPSELSNSFLVVVFAALIQAFDDLRKHNSNRVKAANALFLAAADHVVNHAILQLKDLTSLDEEDEPPQTPSDASDIDIQTTEIAAKNPPGKGSQSGT